MSFVVKRYRHGILVKRYGPFSSREDAERVALAAVEKYGAPVAKGTRSAEFSKIQFDGPRGGCSVIVEVAPVHPNALR